jgi:hypothetical protein
MRRVEEIERAIKNLSPEEFARIAERIHAIEQEKWDARFRVVPERFDTAYVRDFRQVVSAVGIEPTTY